MPVVQGLVNVATTAASISASVSAGDPPQQILLQADPANNAVVYVGSSLVTSSAYGYLIPAPVSTVPGAALVIGPEKGVSVLGDLYVVATTTTQKVRVLVIT